MSAFICLYSIHVVSANANATLTLNPNQVVASTSGIYLDATLRVDSCFTGLTAKIFWNQLISPSALIVHPPCASPQSMVIFFSHVPGPGPTPGDTTFFAGLWADSDTFNHLAYVTAQAVFHMDPQPTPIVSPPAGGPPTDRVGPPAGPPASTAPTPPAAGPATESPSPVDTPRCPTPAAFVATQPATPGGTTTGGLLILAALLCGLVALAMKAGRRRGATLLLLLLLAATSISCGRAPPGAAAAPPQASAVASPTPIC